MNAEHAGEARLPIEERVLHVASEKKLEALTRTLEHYAPESALVFANRKITVAEIEKAFTAKGVSVASLHGDLEQFDRDRVMAKFRNGSTRVLVATDVAARGQGRYLVRCLPLSPAKESFAVAKTLGQRLS